MTLDARAVVAAVPLAPETVTVTRTGVAGPTVPPVDGAVVPPAATLNAFGVPRLGYATAIGAACGFGIVMGLIGVFVLITGTTAVLVGVAVHVGLFAGVGFGGMLGAVVQAARHIEREEAAARLSRRGS